MNPDPCVSILIPCYNAADWIADCIESALAQSYKSTEVIVLDDGSSDGSWEIIQKYAGRVDGRRQPNAGGNVTRNRLMEMATGEWLQYLDADDWLGPRKIARQIEVLRKLDKPVDVLYGEVKMADMLDDRVGEITTAPISSKDPWELLATWQLPQTGAPLWKKQAIVSVGGWKNDQPCCQEHELYLRLLKAGKVFAYAGPTEAFYRQWSEGTVCKRNVPLVHEKRMEIVMNAREFLLQSGQMTTARCSAICQAAFETARSAFNYDKVLARSLYGFIRDEMKGFQPTGPAAPKSFLILSRVFGFIGAERVAEIKRRLLK